MRFMFHLEFYFIGNEKEFMGMQIFASWFVAIEYKMKFMLYAEFH